MALKHVAASTPEPEKKYLFVETSLLTGFSSSPDRAIVPDFEDPVVGEVGGDGNGGEVGLGARVIACWKKIFFLPICYQYKF